MTRIVYERTPVETSKRGYLTTAQKIARWEALDGSCTQCGLLCSPFGPSVIWDHRQGVFFGQGSKPEDFDCHHNTPECSGAKTAHDATVRAKVKRIIAKESGETGNGPKRTIRSKGFDKGRTRRFDGSVVERAK